MYVGNLMLLMLNLPLIGLFTTFLRTPYPILAPVILAACLIGAYSTNFSSGDVLVMVVAGGLGYLFRKLEFDVAPLVLALVLGSQIEVSLRQSLNINRGNVFVFFERPISLVFMGVIILTVLSPLIKRIYRKMIVEKRSQM
jgi:putative tricarboxylic transport membrane protein